MTGPHPDPLNPTQALEPAAVGAGVALGRMEVAAALSSAISLKRIADALEQPCNLGLACGKGLPQPEPIVIQGGRLPPTRGLALEDISRGMAVEFDFQDSSVRKARP